MSNWERVNMKDVYDGFFDGPHATPKPSNEGPVFLGIKNITEDGRLDLSTIRHISEEEFPRWTKRVLPQPGDIVFSYEATLHRYAMIPEGFRGCLGRRLALIRPNLDKIDAKFLLHYFFGNDWRSTISENLISGATVDRIPLIDFPKFQISLPPLPVQKKITAVLSAYDDLIENNNKRIALLEKAAEEIYREWFVRLRFPGWETAVFHKGIPEGWDISNKLTLNDLCELIVDCEHKTAPTQETGYPSIRTPNIGKGRLLLNGVNRVSEETYKKWTRRAIPQANDLIVAREAPVGNIAIVPDNIAVCLGQRTVLIRPDQSQVAPIYLLFYLLSDGIQAELLGKSTGATVHHLNMRDIRGLRISIIAPKPFQKQFASVVSDFYKQIENLRLKNEKLRKTRDLLLSRLISGKLSVDDLDIQFPPSMIPANPCAGGDQEPPHA